MGIVGGCTYVVSSYHWCTHVMRERERPIRSAWEGKCHETYHPDKAAKLRATGRTKAHVPLLHGTPVLLQWNSGPKKLGQWPAVLLTFNSFPNAHCMWLLLHFCIFQVGTMLIIGLSWRIVINMYRYICTLFPYIVHRSMSVTQWTLWSFSL